MMASRHLAIQIELDSDIRIVCPALVPTRIFHDNHGCLKPESALPSPLETKKTAERPFVPSSL